MSACDLKTAIDRVSCLPIDGKLAVFKNRLKGKLDVVFCDTVRTHKMIKRGVGFIGIFTCKDNKTQLYNKLRKFADEGVDL